MHLPRFALRLRQFLNQPTTTTLRIAIAVTALITTLVTVTDLMPTPLAGVYIVEASCAAIPGASLYQQNGEEEIQSFTIRLTLPDGTPLAGVCLTFTRDLGPGVPPEIVAQCTTDADGVCTVNIPGGVITVNFGNTKIGGVQVDSSQSENTDGLSDASTGGLTYYFPAEQPADEEVVATPGDGGTITVDHAVTNEDGNLVPLPGTPGSDSWPDIPPDFDPAIPDGVDPFPLGDLLPLPEGTVTVRFTPTILQTSAFFDHVYCYFATRAGGYARAPANSGTFLPGGGQYFDLGGVLSGDSRPAQILVAEEQSFDMVLQCWGWQGDELLELGTSTLTQTREQWRGQILSLSGAGFNISYSLPYDNPETQPQNPRLPDVVFLNDLSLAAELPDLENEQVAVVPRTRFSDEIPAPTNLQLSNKQLNWDYDTDFALGGFRVFRNGYLIGIAPSDARGWIGDGLVVTECGESVEYAVTAYSGGQESLPSNTVAGIAETCVAQVTVTFDQIGLSGVNDCDGSQCGTLPEIYGYLLVNDAAIFFGGGSTPLYTRLKFGETFTFSQLLAPFGEANVLTVGVGVDAGLTIEVALFDHDSETSDDILCSWQENLPSRSTEDWQAQHGRVISRDGKPGESGCNFTVTLTIE